MEYDIIISINGGTFMFQIILDEINNDFTRAKWYTYS